MQILSLETCAQQGYESESKTIPFVWFTQILPQPCALLKELPTPLEI
jgi:hypothetical protein